MAITRQVSSKIKSIAQAGLVSKGIVYCLLGVLTFMSAFHLNGQSTNAADKGGVFSFVQEQAGGNLMLGIIVLGLLCYSLWRVMQAFGDTENKGNDAKGWATRGRYFFSALVYLAVAVLAIKILLEGKKNSGDSKEGFAQELLSKPLGQWLVGIAAVAFFAVGIYQIYYALSEKYRKHIEKSAHTSGRKILSAAGKVGYISRGIVWLLLSWLFMKAALHSNSSEAGDTSKAFSLLLGQSYGEYLLAGVGLGLIAYGLFNFIRVRYENLDVK